MDLWGLPWAMAYLTNDRWQLRHFPACFNLHSWVIVSLYTPMMVCAINRTWRTIFFRPWMITQFALDLNYYLVLKALTSKHPQVEMPGLCCFISGVFHGHNRGLGSLCQASPLHLPLVGREHNRTFLILSSDSSPTLPSWSSGFQLGSLGPCSRKVQMNVASL